MPAVSNNTVKSWKREDPVYSAFVTIVKPQ